MTKRWAPEDCIALSDLACRAACRSLLLHALPQHALLGMSWSSARGREGGRLADMCNHPQPRADLPPLQATGTMSAPPPPPPPLELLAPEVGSGVKRLSTTEEQSVPAKNRAPGSGVRPSLYTRRTKTLMAHFPSLRNKKYCTENNVE